MKEQHSEMTQRIAVGGTLACLVLGLIFLSPYAPWSLLFLGMLIGTTLLAIREYDALVHAKEDVSLTSPFVWWGYISAIVYLILHSLVLHSYLSNQAYRLFWMTALISIFALALCSSKRQLSVIALTFFSLCYIVAPLGEVLTILYGSNGGDDLRLWLLYGIVATKITDTAALFIGRRFGRHLLAERLSPKKTWEGAVGGLIAALGWSLASVFISRHWGLFFSISYLEAGLLGICLSLFGQLGDMAESMLKRDAGVKDSGVLPGLGGVLDLIDSLLFTMPLLACFLRLRYF